MDIGRRIYYDKSTGTILANTGERNGNVVETTIEQDFTVYVSLTERVPETVGVIELAYGNLAQDFQECNGYRINPTTLQIEFSYPDPSIPDAPPVYRKSLSQEVAELRDGNVQTNNQVIDLWETLISAGVL